MSPYVIIAVIASYFAVMILVAYFAGKGADNLGYFNGNRKLPWYLVAFAMIGSAMSGVTFVSVPGMVGASAFGYMQMTLGFIAGQLVIAYVLVPLFYKMNLISIYQYLEERFGLSTYRTGAWFFFISKMFGASVRLFLVCLTLQLLVFSPLGIPFSMNVLISMLVVLAYTYKGGVKSVIWTDALKTLCMIVSVALCIIFICKNLHLNFKCMSTAIKSSSMSRIFFFDDIRHPQYFFKQFFAGMFTLIAMTGLDQDMMQRTLSCKTPQDARKNVITTALLQTVVIFCFLCLGVLLYLYVDIHGMNVSGDSLFPAVAVNGHLPLTVGVLFILGLVSCAYSSGGSALTSLTTSFTVDILGIKATSDKKLTAKRQAVHLTMALMMEFTILIFNLLNNTSAIDAVYKLASYTYGPILGMFTFGILMPYKVRDAFVPLVAIISPLVCLILQLNSARWFSGYVFSYELLILNALFTFLGLCCLIRK